MSLRLGRHDRRRPLVIDPLVISYCGYLGGPSGDGAHGIAVDAAGNAYVAGYTDSAGSFPVTVGPQVVPAGGWEAYIAKVRADGTGLVYAGFIGGADDEGGVDVAVDATGAAYVLGHARSDERSFPVLGGPRLTHAGMYDAFIAKVAPDGSALVFAGYIGGEQNDYARAIALDGAGAAYVVGRTESIGFPVVVGPGTTPGGSMDGWVAKVAPDGSALEYAGYVGGAATDFSWDVAVGGDGSAYRVGTTASTETTFPVSGGPSLTHAGPPGGYDGWLARVAPDGSRLLHCGYVGGSGSDFINGVELDAAGRIYLVGRTESDQRSFPVAVGPDLTFNNGWLESDGFVARLAPDTLRFDYCGYIGGSGSDEVHGVAVGAGGEAYVAGKTASSEANFPTLGGPDPTFNGATDGFVARVLPDGSGLDRAGYLGGAFYDAIQGVALGPGGSVHVCGETTSPETGFPAVVGPFLVYGGPTSSLPGDGFVARIDDLPCAQAARAIRRLLAVKDPAAPADVLLEWGADPAAAGYNVWYVARKEDLPSAGLAASPPALPVPGCATPAPAPGASCRDAGGVARAGAACFHYTVRAFCDPSTEGP